VEAALRRLLASPDTSSTFHDPVVHAAIQDVRSDLRNITKYRDDPAVMQVGGVAGTVFCDTGQQQ
jgi:hypothetical protein